MAVYTFISIRGKRQKPNAENNKRVRTVTTKKNLLLMWRKTRIKRGYFFAQKSVNSFFYLDHIPEKKKAGIKYNRGINPKVPGQYGQR